MAVVCLARSGVRVRAESGWASYMLGGEAWLPLRAHCGVRCGPEARALVAKEDWHLSLILVRGNRAGVAEGLLRSAFVA